MLVSSLLWKVVSEAGQHKTSACNTLKRFRKDYEFLLLRIRVVFSNIIQGSLFPNKGLSIFVYPILSLVLKNKSNERKLKSNLLRCHAT